MAVYGKKSSDFNSEVEMKHFGFYSAHKCCEAN